MPKSTKAIRFTQHYMPDNDYAFLVMQLRDSGDSREFAPIVWTLAEVGAVFPGAISDRMNSLSPPSSPVWSVEYLRELADQERPEGSDTLFEDILPDIAAELDKIIECFSRYTPPAPPAL